MKLKKKLISATLSLVVATVLMASSSYAWFTISTNPEISKIKTSITANENIEIALDNGYENAEAIDAASAVVSGTGTAGNPYTWGNLLDMSTAMTNIGANLSLKPVGYSTKTEGSETKVVMKTPQYGLDGRVAKLVDMAQEYIAAYDGVTTPSGGISIFKQTEDTDEADALALSFWLRANADVSLMLSEGTYRADDGENTAGTVNAESGLGSRLTLSAPEAFAKALPLYDSVCLSIDGLYVPLHSLQAAVEEGLTEAAYQEIQRAWSTAYADHLAVFSSELEGQPLTYRSKIRFFENFYDESIHEEISISEINRCFSLTLDDFLETSFYKDFYDTSYVDFYTYLSPSDQLLRFLKKIRIRFIVTSDEGTQELMARISPVLMFKENGCRQLDDEWFSFHMKDENGDDAAVEFSSDMAWSFNGLNVFEQESYWSEGDSSISFNLQFFDNESSEGDYDLYKNARSNIEVINQFAYEYHHDDSFRATENNSALYCATDPTLVEELGVENVMEALFDHLYQLANEELIDQLEQFPHIDLTANEAKKVDVYMYLDGEAVTNADAVTMDGLELALNLQFEKIGGATNAMTGRVYVEESESESDEE